jgi:hypothetical protein
MYFWEETLPWVFSEVAAGPPPEDRVAMACRRSAATAEACGSWTPEGVKTLAVMPDRARASSAGFAAQVKSDFRGPE